MERQWRCSGIFIVNSEHIAHLVLVFVFLILSLQLPAGMLASNGAWSYLTVHKSFSRIVTND